MILFDVIQLIISYTCNIFISAYDDHFPGQSFTSVCANADLNPIVKFVSYFGTLREAEHGLCNYSGSVRVWSG
jgi:hypothetical protein